MRRPHTAGRRGRRSPGRLTLVLVLCGGALGAWGLARIPALSKQRPPATHETETAALVAPKTQSLAPKTTRLDTQANGTSNGLEVTGVQARHIRSRSPLESAPGYYPPADPESMAAVTGRREAPLVEGELSGGAESLEDLARALLEALERRDERALHALRVTRDEFETILWPELPQSRPVTNIKVDEVWGFATAQSVSAASGAVGLYGGRSLAFLRVDFSRTETFRNLFLHRDVRILIRDPKGGRVVSLSLVPSVVERHNRYKALIFKD